MKGGWVIDGWVGCGWNFDQHVCLPIGTHYDKVNVFSVWSDVSVDNILGGAMSPGKGYSTLHVTQFIQGTNEFACGVFQRNKLQATSVLTQPKAPMSLLQPLAGSRISVLNAFSDTRGDYTLPHTDSTDAELCS